MSWGVNKSQPWRDSQWPRLRTLLFGLWLWSRWCWCCCCHSRSVSARFPWKHHFLVSVDGRLSRRNQWHLSQLDSRHMSLLAPQYLLVSWRLDRIPVLAYHHCGCFPCQLSGGCVGGMGAVHTSHHCVSSGHCFSHLSLWRWEAGTTLQHPQLTVLHCMSRRRHSQGKVRGRGREQESEWQEGEREWKFICWELFLLGRVLHKAVLDLFCSLWEEKLTDFLRFRGAYCFWSPSRVALLGNMREQNT